MLVIVGTIPDENLPLTKGELDFDGSKLTINDRVLDIERGTAAMASAAYVTSHVLNVPLPIGLFIGDIGDGDGSRELYSYLIKNVGSLGADIIAFHYFMPDVNLHNKVLKAINALKHRPKLIADAGYMYVAKMSGHASEYELFTPDQGELAFLADEKAPHPFFTRGFILYDERDTDEKIKRAYKHGNASKALLVKGETDYIALDRKIIEKINEPFVENLEPIGGTGDTITGIVSALIHSGIDTVKASVSACRANRIAGQLANPTPATHVSKIIAKIPEAIETVIKEN
jgi:hypothetical protein